MPTKPTRWPNELHLIIVGNNHSGTWENGSIGGQPVSRFTALTAHRQVLAANSLGTGTFEIGGSHSPPKQYRGIAQTWPSLQDSQQCHHKPPTPQVVWHIWMLAAGWSPLLAAQASLAL